MDTLNPARWVIVHVIEIAKENSQFTGKKREDDMNIRALRLTMISICIFGIVSPFSYAFFDNEVRIDLERIPEAVMTAAKCRLPGFDPLSAEREISKKYTDYEIEGTVNGRRYAVEIRVDKRGNIIQVRAEKEDD